MQPTYTRHDVIPFTHIVVLFFLLVLLCIPAFFWGAHQKAALWFYDDVEHILGGVFLFMSLSFMFRNQQLAHGVFFFLCMGGVALIGGIFWEAGWYFFRDFTIGDPDRFITLKDTITDQLYDVGGGMLAWMYYHMPRALVFAKA